MNANVRLSCLCVRLSYGNVLFFSIEYVCCKHVFVRIVCESAFMTHVNVVETGEGVCVSEVKVDLTEVCEVICGCPLPFCVFPPSPPSSLLACSPFLPMTSSLVLLPPPSPHLYPSSHLYLPPSSHFNLPLPLSVPFLVTLPLALALALA